MESRLTRMQSVACHCDAMLHVPMPKSYALHTARPPLRPSHVVRGASAREPAAQPPAASPRIENLEPLGSLIPAGSHLCEVDFPLDEGKS